MVGSKSRSIRSCVLLKHLQLTMYTDIKWKLSRIHKSEFSLFELFHNGDVKWSGISEIKVNLRNWITSQPIRLSQSPLLDPTLAVTSGCESSFAKTFYQLATPHMPSNQATKSPRLLIVPFRSMWTSLYTDSAIDLTSGLGPQREQKLTIPVAMSLQG